MSYIEGIGDELLFVFAILFLLLISALVWLSTSVIEPRISVIIIDARRFQQLLSRVRNAGIRIINLNRGLNNEEGNNTTVVESNENVPDDSNNAEHDNEQENNVESAETADITSSRLDSIDCKENIKSEFTNTKTVETVISANHIPTTSQDVNVNTQNTTLSQNDDESSLNHVDSSQAETLAASVKPTSDNSPSPSNCDNFESSNDTFEEHIENVESSPCGSSVNTPSEGGNTSQSTAKQTESPSNNGSSLPEGHIRIKLKYLDDRQKMVQAMPQQTIGEFKRSHFAGELSENFMVRLIYNGQELRQDTHQLQTYNIRDSSVIHCLLSENRREESNIIHNEEEDYNIGTYIFPLFGVILGLIWYSRFSYGRYFNAISTLSLIGISFMYAIALLATFRRREGDAEIHEHAD